MLQKSDKVGLENFQNHDVTGTYLENLAQTPDKIGQEHGINVHQSQNNTPFAQNNSSEIQTIDLQFVFKNEDKEVRITHLYTIFSVI